MLPLTNLNKEAFIKYKSSITLILIIILIISGIISSLFPSISKYMCLYPSNLNEPRNWYRLITYSFYLEPINTWFVHSFSILLFAYFIEIKLKKVEMLALIMLSSIIGGLFFMIFNQNIFFAFPIGSPSMIEYGYWSASLVIGIKYWKTYTIFEKIVLIYILLCVVNIYNSNPGIFAGHIFVTVIILILILLKLKIQKLIL
jgi:membrane associated rhomboid family serine protease